MCASKYKLPDGGHPQRQGKEGCGRTWEWGELGNAWAQCKQVKLLTVESRKSDWGEVVGPGQYGGLDDVLQHRLQFSCQSISNVGCILYKSYQTLCTRRCFNCRSQHHLFWSSSSRDSAHVLIAICLGLFLRAALTADLGYESLV